MPYRQERAWVIERVYRTLRAAGLQHDICNEEIAKAAGFKHADYVDQVRRECPARYVVGEIRSNLTRADIDRRLAALKDFFIELRHISKLKTLTMRRRKLRSRASYLAVAKHLRRKPK